MMEMKITVEAPDLAASILKLAEAIASGPDPALLIPDEPLPVSAYDEALVYDRKPKTLSELEKLMGKAEFAEKIGGFVTKPLGKPTLAPASDKREAYAPAASDFAGVVDG